MTELNTVNAASFPLVPFMLALTRVSSFIVASPLLGRQTVPNGVKLGLCLALTMFLLPRYVENWSNLAPTQSVLLSVGMEFVVGISLGFLIRLVLLPARVAGSYIGQELGFNLGQVADPSTGAQTNEAGLLFDAFGLVLFWVTDTHHMALRMVTLSIGSLRGDRAFLDAMTVASGELVSFAHQMGITMVSPLASVLFLLLVYLGIAMRAWSQVTLFSFGMGARLLLGLVAFFLFMPVLMHNMAAGIQGMTVSIAEWVSP